MQTAIEAAQSKVDAIDKRIDAVHAELLRHSQPFDEMSCHAWQRAWDSYPGLWGIEKSLYLRRAEAADIRDKLIFRKARADERRAAREFAKQSKMTRQACPMCGQMRAA